MYPPSTRYHQFRLPAACLLAFGFLTLVIGCGPDYKARANVKGKVSIGKKPLTSGTVMFHGKNGITSTASIKPNGDYEMTDAPIGEVTITVEVAGLPMDPSVRARMKAKAGDFGKGVEGSKNPEGGEGIALMPEMPKEIVPIPEKFSKPDTSGLKYNVEKGEHTHDIEL